MMKEFLKICETMMPEKDEEFVVMKACYDGDVLKLAICKFLMENEDYDSQIVVQVLQCIREDLYFFPEVPSLKLYYKGNVVGTLPTPTFLKKKHCGYLQTTVKSDNTLGGIINNMKVISGKVEMLKQEV